MVFRNIDKNDGKMQLELARLMKETQRGMDESNRHNEIIKLQKEQNKFNKIIAVTGSLLVIWGFINIIINLIEKLELKCYSLEWIILFSIPFIFFSFYGIFMYFLFK